MYSLSETWVYKLLFSKKSVSVVLLVFAALFILRASIFHPILIPGNDYFWHIEYGKYFMANFSLPPGDWLTWTVPDQPYQITQWLGQLLFALAADAGGGLMVSFTVAAISSAILYFSWRTAYIYIAHPVLAVFVALGCVFSVLTLNARPQLFGLLAFSALVWVLSVWFERKSRWALLALSVIMIAWVNLHGSYIVGLAYIAALGGGAWLFTFAEMKGRFVDSVRAHQSLAIASFTAVFAVLLNPYGWRAFEYVWNVAQLETTKSGVITEWLATSLSTAHGESFFMVVICVLISVTTAKVRPSFKVMIGFAGTVYFGLIADRQTLFALIALVPFFAQSIKGSTTENLFEKSFAALVSPAKAVALLLASSLAAVLINGAVKNIISEKYFEFYPVNAIKFLDDQKIEGKLFNKVEIGGYIASTGRKVFIDGRLDLFGDEMALGTMNALNGKPGWEKFIDKYKPDLFLLNNSDTLLELISAKKNCISIYKDSQYSIVRCGQ